MTGDASIAALSRKLDEGCTALIDEIDELERDKRDLVYSALRRGYRPNNIHLRYDYKNKTYETINIFGPKAFSFQGDIEDALRSRTFVINTVSLKKDVVDTVLANMVWSPSELASRIKRFCEKAAKRWTSEKVKEELQQEDFKSLLQAVFGHDPFPRHVETAAICLLISRIAGIDSMSEVRSALGQQDAHVDELMLEIVQFVKDNLGGRETGSYMTMKELRIGFNRLRKEAGDKPIHHKLWRKLLREAGLREGKELKRLAGNGRHVLVLTDHALKCFASIETPSDTSQTPAGWFTEAVESFTADKDTSHRILHSEAFVKYLRSECEGICEVNGPNSPGFFTLEDILHRPEFKDRKDEVEKWIKKWKQEGEIIEPILGSGRYKFI
jgi:hypothetical protein